MWERETCFALSPIPSIRICFGFRIYNRQGGAHRNFVESPPFFSQIHGLQPLRRPFRAIENLMPTLNLKPANSCKYDLLALGEIMLRLDPGEGRVRTTRELKVWEGGGEYNVARG